jgi:hypothetical protein
MQKDLMSGFLAVVAMTVTSLLEATIVERWSKRLNATCGSRCGRCEGTDPRSCLLQIIRWCSYQAISHLDGRVLQRNSARFVQWQWALTSAIADSLSIKSRRVFR